MGHGFYENTAFLLLFCCVFFLSCTTSVHGKQQDAPSPAAGQEWQRHSPWQGGEGVEQGAATEGEGGGGRVVYLTTPCTTLEAFVETKVCMYTDGACDVVFSLWTLAKASGRAAGSGGHLLLSADETICSTCVPNNNQSSSVDDVVFCLFVALV